MAETLNLELLNKTIYVCPVDGIVSADDSFTHRHELFVLGDKVTIITTAYFYMSEGIEVFVIETDKEAIRAKIDTDRINDYDDELLDSFPDAFIETIVYFMT